jgi:hypothetical protein
MKIKLLSLLAMTVIGGTAQSADVSRVREVAGTYELIICKSACSFSEPGNVVATGVVVLFDHVMAREDVERSVTLRRIHFCGNLLRYCVAIQGNLLG